MNFLVQVLLICSWAQIITVDYPSVFLWDDDVINVPLEMMFIGQNLTYEADTMGSVQDKYWIKNISPNDTAVETGFAVLYVSRPLNNSIFILDSNYTLYFLSYSLLNKTYTYSNVLACYGSKSISYCLSSPIYDDFKINFICVLKNGSFSVLSLGIYTLKCGNYLATTVGMVPTMSTGLYNVISNYIVFVNGVTFSSYTFSVYGEAATLYFYRNITFKYHNDMKIIKTLNIYNTEILVATSNSNLCTLSYYQCVEYHMGQIDMMYFDEVSARVVATVLNTNIVIEITYPLLYIANSYTTYNYDVLYFSISTCSITVSRSYIVIVYRKYLQNDEVCIIRIITRYSNSYQNIHSEIPISRNCSYVTVTVVDYANDLFLIYNNGSLRLLDVFEPIYKLNSVTSKKIAIRASNNNFAVVNYLNIEYAGRMYFLTVNQNYAKNFNISILGNFEFDFNINSLFIGRLFNMEAKSSCYDVVMGQQVLLINRIKVNMSGYNVTPSIYRIGSSIYYGVNYIDWDGIMRTDYFFMNASTLSSDNVVCTKNTTSPMAIIVSTTTGDGITAILAYSSSFGGNEYLYLYNANCQNYILALVIPGLKYNQVIIDEGGNNLFLISTSNDTTLIDYYVLSPFRLLSLLNVKSYTINFKSYYTYMKLNSTNYIAYLGLNSTGGLFRSANPEYVGDDYFTNEKYQENLKGALFLESKIILFYSTNITIMESYNIFCLHYPIQNTIVVNLQHKIIATQAFDDNYFIIITVDYNKKYYYALYQIDGALNSKLLHYYDITQYINIGELLSIYVEEFGSSYAHLHLIHTSTIYQFRILINEMANIKLSCFDKTYSQYLIEFDASDIVNNKAYATLTVAATYFSNLDPHVKNDSMIAFDSSNYSDISMCSIFEGYSLNYYVNITNDPSFKVEPTYNFTYDFAQLSSSIVLLFSQDEYLNVLYYNGSYTKYKYNEIVSGLITVNTSDLDCSSSSLVAEYNGIIFILCIPSSMLFVYVNNEKKAEQYIMYRPMQLSPFEYMGNIYLAVLESNMENEEPFIYIYQFYFIYLSFVNRRPLAYKIGAFKLNSPASISVITDEVDCFVISYQNYGILSFGIFYDNSLCTYYDSNLKSSYSYDGTLYTGQIIVNSSLMYMATNHGVYSAYTSCISQNKGNISQSPRQSNEMINQMQISSDYIGMLSNSISGMSILYIYKLINESYIVPFYEYSLDSVSGMLQLAMVSVHNTLICYISNGDTISQLLINTCPSLKISAPLNDSLLIEAKSTFAGYQKLLSIDIVYVKYSIAELVYKAIVIGGALLIILLTIVAVVKIRRRKQKPINEIEAMFIRSRKMSDPLRVEEVKEA